MIVPDAGQAALATKAGIRSVTLVRCRTWSNRLTNTLGQTFYWSTVPVRYQWTAGTDTQFESRIRQVSAIVRGAPHIPDGVTVGVRDGITITLDLSIEGSVWPWTTLGNEFLHGARIDVATLLLEDGQFEAPDPYDLTAMGAVHVIRWRGEVTSTTDYDWEKGTVALNCDTIEPTLAWPTARDPLTNDPRDTGKRYPLPVGLARGVELVGILVGHATTLAADVAATGTASWSITDGEGFPTSGTFTVKAGDELVTAFGPTSTPTSLSISARAILGSPSTQHARGSTIVEVVREIRFAASAREIQRVAALYWQVPSGQRVRLEPGAYGVNVAASEIEAGETLAVVSMARDEITAALAAVNAVLQQPVLSASGVAIAKLAFSAWSGTSGTTASVGPAVHSLDSFVNVDSPAGVRMDYVAATSDRVAILWATVAEQPTANVRRIRPVFDLRIDSLGANPTVIKWEMDSHQIGSVFMFNAFSEQLVSQGGTATVRTQVAGSWQTPVNPTTVADLLGIDIGANGGTHGFHACIYLNNTAGGTAGAGFFVYTSSSYWEVEIDPPAISTVVGVDVAAAWAVGDGLKLVADLGGVVSRANEAAVSALDFTTTTGWTAVNCTLSVQTTAGRVGIRLASPTNAATVDLVKTGLSLNWAASGASITFEVYITAANKDRLTATGGRYVELKVGTNSTDMYVYPFSPGDLVDDAWTTLTADLVWHGSRIKLGAGATLSNVTRVELGPAWDSTSGGPQIHFRNVRYVERTVIDHPIDVAAFVIEEMAGLTGAVEAATRADAIANLPSALFAGDLRNAGDGFVPILARLGYESRTNWVTVEGASGTLYRPMTPSPTGFSGANYAYDAPVKTISRTRRLLTATRQLDEIATQFSALWDYRPEPNGSQIEAYRKVARCDEVVNDIVAKISAAQLSNASQSVGLRESLPNEFRMIVDAATLLEVWSFYVAEALRFGGANARRFALTVEYVDGWDLEPLDVVNLVTPWNGSTVKCRVTRVAFAPDSPGIGLSLEQVI